MTKTLVKPRLFSNKLQQKPKHQISNNQSTLLPNLQSFKQKVISGNSSLVYKYGKYI